VYKVQTYLKVRQAYYNENKSIRQISREIGISRHLVGKMVKNALPPGYVRQKEILRPKLSDHVLWIDEILESDKKAHPKQRHTAKRLYHRLKEERAFTGGYTIVRTYVAKKRLKSKEMFVPLSHDPGMAQCDFGEAMARIQGKLCKAHYLVMQLPFSDDVFVKAFAAENTESFCDGHVSAFIYFGGVPYRILYDNTKIAVKKILKDGKRMQTDAFIALRSHYLFKEGFANVARGNEKGGVENLVGFVRRNFMVPLPDFESFDDLNAHLVACCLKRHDEIKRGHEKTVGQRLMQESFLPLPALPYECCRIQAGKVTSQGLVRFQNNDYSVPTHIGQQQVLIKGYVTLVRIIFENKCIAEHPRCYGREEVLFNPLHYLKLLERKTGAFEQAAPLKGWILPPIFQKVHDILYRKGGKDGRRSYIRILMFLETYGVGELKEALEQAVTQYVVDESVIKHLLRRLVEKKPVNLSLHEHPTVPVVCVPLPDLSVYGALLSCRVA
jgi:transposase